MSATTSTAGNAEDLLAVRPRGPRLFFFLGRPARICVPLLLAACCSLTVAAAPSSRRVAIETSEGMFTIELYPDLAPLTVARFLARAGVAAPSGEDRRTFPYAGSVLCESRAHGYLIFGCVPPAPGALSPEPPRRESATPDEIDARSMGLGGLTISEPHEREWLWQQEIFPRYLRLREEGKAVPPGLERLVGAIRVGGAAASSSLDGKSRLEYLESIGYRYASGRSSLRVARGALATANVWPGEADERFLVALDDLPDRDGRATVFGRVVEGWDALDAIQAIPVDKSHHTIRPVSVRSARESAHTGADGRRSPQR